MMAEEAHNAAAAQLAYKALCKATRQAARHDRSKYMLGRAHAMEEAMRSGRLQQAFGIAAELRGGGRAPRVEAIRVGTAIAYGDKVAPALAQHFHATLNVDTAVAPELLAAIPATNEPPPVGAGEVAWAATARPQVAAQLQQGGGRQTRAQAAAAGAERQAREETEEAAAEASNGEPATLEEVQRAVAALRNTAPGQNGLQAQLLKLGDLPAAQWMQRCFAAAWQSGRAPAAWKRASLVPIHKKGDRLEADNYRGVTLLDVVGKVYVTVLHNRIRNHLCGQLLDCQHGFRPGRGTGDALFSMRRLVELARDFKAPLHAAFVDFRKAFDSVNRPTLWRLLKARGVAPKLVDLIEDLYSGCEACISANGHTSPWFPMGTGVRQGCPMSPTLFNVFMDFMARLVAGRSQQQGAKGYGVAFRISGQLVTPPTNADELVWLLMLLYADDMALLANSQKGLETALAALEQVGREWGMSINYPKTQGVVFAPAGQPGPPPPMQLQHGQVAFCEEFCYIGGTQAGDGSLGPEMGRRLRLAGRAFQQLRKRVFSSAGASLRTRMAIYKAIVVPTLLYGAPESWAPTSSQLQELDVFNSTCLRSIIGATRRHPDMLSNAELYRITGQAAISEALSERRLRWLGHVARKPDSSAVKQLLFATAPAAQAEGQAGSGRDGMRRVMGGPSASWNRAAQGDLVSVYSSQAAATGWFRDSQDREKWKGIVSPH